ncbi:tRNA lysidine(34) synthetase TilS [Helicobacter cetorum]|uniref:tRNA lysidine(34) synthetase TilS n=1 Tax=Helicobacter cetorum TaxID=138563 RepID=UPI000CF091EB|nr:tRNA lysidine(34) synthetase TilS [Helicobacter cetorum]
MQDFKTYLEPLRESKNLLGFSGGIDSVFLFYLLVKENINFDIALVDYNTQEKRLEIIKYAQKLAQTHHKKCYIHYASKITHNFEMQARKVRYDFFEKLIKEHSYKHLILAHHLNDRLEWFLMQLSKGAGLNTLLSFQAFEKREQYSIIRPLLYTPKDKIKTLAKDLKFFQDCTNTSLKFKRNFFRMNYANSLMQNYSKGIIQSFKFLDKEKEQLYPNIEISQIHAITFFKHSQNSLFTLDKILKQKGYLLSFSQKEEIKRSHFSLEIAQKFIIENNNEHVFIAHKPPKILSMPKDFKDKARKLSIPKRLRPILYMEFLKQTLKIHDFLIDFKESLKGFNKLN